MKVGVRGRQKINYGDGEAPGDWFQEEKATARRSCQQTRSSTSMQTETPQRAAGTRFQGGRFGKAVIQIHRIQSLSTRRNRSRDITSNARILELTFRAQESLQEASNSGATITSAEPEAPRPHQAG